MGDSRGLVGVKSSSIKVTTTEGRNDRGESQPMVRVQGDAFFEGGAVSLPPGAEEESPPRESFKDRPFSRIWREEGRMITGVPRP